MMNRPQALPYLVGLVLLVCSPSFVRAQADQLERQPYQAKKGLFYASFATWSGVKIYGWSRKSSALSKPLDPDALWAIDRQILERTPDPGASKLSDVVLGGAMLAPLGLMIVHKSRWRELLFITAQGFLIENTLSQLTKHIARRPRPGVYRQAENPFGRELHPNSTRSFYSGHASTTAYFAVTTARIYSVLHPDNPTKYAFWGGAGIITAGVSALRVRSGKHFVSDVVVGSLVGGTLGVLVPALLHTDRIFLGPVSTEGLSLVWTF
ncbi:MAG: phosphatase PAP2 family protein [Saprospiraceae bacterium]|nr:phosphatase PAP2 family protein [Saprospiraceae bacterium]